MNTWFPIEKSYHVPAASLLGGRQLELLSNGRYAPGGHLVRSYPNSPTEAPSPSTIDPTRNYRYSIVFVLRAHSPIPVNTDNLTTSFTGQFKKPMRDITALEMFRQINSSHYNINTSVQERQEQRERLAKIARERQEREAALASNSLGEKR
jgi:hypothetical protein